MLILVGGLVAGGLLVWWFMVRTRQGEVQEMRGRVEELERERMRLESERQVLERGRELVEGQVLQLRDDYKALDIQHRQLLDESSTLREQNRGLKEKLDEYKKDIEAIQERFKDQFKVLAEQILEEKSQKFTLQNQQNIKQLLDPLGERLTEFRKKVEDTYNLEMKERVTLQQQIVQLTELNQSMQLEAKNLTNALKGDSKVQGNWGEIILERVLEKSGLVRDREYRVQVSGTNEEGKRIQPDVIIDLPDNRNLIIDSKVSITAFERYVNAEIEEEKARAEREHIQSVRAHIKGLSEKSYQSMYDMNSPDFVLMFIPVEPAFAMTIQRDPELYMDALSRNIVIVSPTTLLATLSTIASIWKQEHQTRNAMDIATQGGALYDKFVGFVEDLEAIGTRLDQTQASYSQAMNKLKDGRGNLIRRVQKLQELGVKASRQLPPQFTDSQSGSSPDDK